MATLTFIEKKCYVCNAVGRFGEGGFLMFSPPVGLDGHPSNLTPLFTAIHICPHCFYASPDISEGNEIIASIVKDERYQAIAGNGTIHELVRKYIAWALIQNRIGNDCEAARTMLYATWLSEQYGQVSATSQCRRRAITLMNSCLTQGGNFEMTRGKELLAIADLYRREQMFDEALALCEDTLAKHTLSEDDEFLLRYEEKLIRNHNSLYATIAEAEKNF